MVSVELQAVGEAVGLGGGPDQHHGGKELGVPFMPLLFPQHQQEVVAEARVHDDPVRWGGEVHVRGQEDYLSSLQDINPVHLPQVGHHHLQVAFPLAGEQGAYAGCHLGGMQLCLLVVEVVRVGMVAEVVVGAVVVVVEVVGEVVMGAAALLWCTLSDGVTAGHILLLGKSLHSPPGSRAHTPEVCYLHVDRELCSAVGACAVRVLITL